MIAWGMQRVELRGYYEEALTAKGAANDAMWSRAVPLDSTSHIGPRCASARKIASVSSAGVPSDIVASAGIRYPFAVTCCLEYDVYSTETSAGPSASLHE